MTATFSCDLNGLATELPHFWEHTIGSGHATLGLRADWQAQLKRTHDELGMRYVRFHGILCDEMGTLIGEGNTLFYSFFNADLIFDYLRSIGMRPFVELSFMPVALASGDKTAFHYRANVTPPKDYAQWAVLIRKLVSHWVGRYGLDEVRQWFFEVWNEPNLTAFGSGKQSDYFELYRYTAEAIKGVDKLLRVGGPATADNAWIEDFLNFCRTGDLPADFVSTHHYPTDDFGQPGDDTEAQLAASKRSALRDEARGARKQAGDVPLYYTEWCTSSNPRDPLHDDPYAAAFIVKTVLEANGLVEGYSYWTFSDIFEENYFPSLPFQGGFGLLNIHGIAKPAYRAFQLLHGAGTEMLPVEGAHETVDAWFVRGDGASTLILTNFALPRHPIKTEEVLFTLKAASTATTACVQRIDAEHANAKRRWEEMGKPEYLDAPTVDRLKHLSELRSEPVASKSEAGSLVLKIALPPLSVAAIRLANT
ncbi:MULTISPECIES: glycosyl hydrolase [unclassified Mesorhizobium]|uniref:GH39 family glycosyl hydrolase n=1 Tax=unclassified Mesorhizobium TaxID=325217 RepID=UPI00112CA2CD|nr:MULTISPECIES: glycosyl hydrolase [unclassified Mesorhizobium]TPJ46079.1 beta-xylosidase [Mesorhizobium sp. B2-6-6]MBZ9982361.1 beta-xylosidase [Mesorhizobium sp. BR-1-1-8]MCA0008580.1 beta-xylosidase [Mesorhizobium sp. B264B1B]MCA0018821.1 beta-xylosidase [Mesorhizobium sp. B264B1A]MCA0025800.1 beta-xylosidase [Mesorhizobium sp. B263B1A]